MAYSNGRIPSSALGRVPGTGPYGGPHLRKDAARAYTALHNYSMRRWGISMVINESSIGRTYRSYARQVLAKRTYGRNAATPGFSNHGWGLAVDLMTRQQRWVIDQVGHLFGFSKRWSDAAWEWWHVKFLPGRYSMVARWTIPPTLRPYTKGPNIRRLQQLLRAKGYRSVRVTGYYGKATLEAVKKFQRAHKLKPDGIVGPNTWKALL